MSRRPQHVNFNVFSFLLFILLMVNCSDALFEGCTHSYNINPGYSYLESPYYPNYYPSGTSCLYKFTAPLDYQIQVNCTLDMDKGANACSTEFFYLARDGDTQLRGSEQFCGSGNFVRNSLFRSVALAYASYGSWGRFQCQLYVYPQPCDCGWSVNMKILNGQEAGVNEYPAMVSLRDTSSNLRSFCGACIISHRYLISAAHCTRAQPDPSKIIALMGDHNLASNSESRYAVQHQILQIIEHQYYTTDPVMNDIALLKTVDNIEWSRGVGPICLPPPNLPSTYFDYQNIDVIGWGTTSFGGPTSNTLQKIQLIVIDNTACQEHYKGVTKIYPSQLCSYDSTGSSKDSCQFDSGGPVILRKARQFLLGCISFGKVCGQGGYAVGVNTRISSYLTWINQNIGGSTCQVPL